MARGESLARTACKQEACSQRDVGPKRGSMELPGRARHQQAPVGGGGSIRRRLWGARNDCVVFATKIMEIWYPTLDLHKIFSQDDIQHIRIQYMNQLFFCKKDTAYKRLLTCFNLQGDFANSLP